MPQGKKASQKSQPGSKQSNKTKEYEGDGQYIDEMDSTDIRKVLHQDHLRLADMFFKYRYLKDEEDKRQLAEQIIQELHAHTAAEEELVYSEVRKKGKGKDEVSELMDEASTEHHVAKVLMAEISAMEPSEDQYDAKVITLGELIAHHVQEEEKQMFEKMEASGLNLDELGKKVAERKQELQMDFTPMDVAEIFEQLELYR